MLAQNLLQGCLMNLQPAANTKNSQNSTQNDISKGTSVKFKDVLGVTSAKDNTQQNSYKKTVKSDVNTDKLQQSADTKPVTYRQVAAKTVDSANKTEVKKSEPETSVGVSSETAAESVISKPDALIISLAQMLGLNPDDLQKTLDFLNISLKDLADPSNAKEIADKLSTLAGFNQQQEQTLEKLIEIVSQKVITTAGSDNATACPEKASASDKQEKTWFTTGIKNIEVVDENKQAEDFKTIISAVKEKLDSISVKLESNPEQVLSAISDSIKKTLNDMKEQVEKVKVTLPEDSTDAASKTTDATAKTAEAAAKTDEKPVLSAKPDKSLITGEKAPEGQEEDAMQAETKEKLKETLVSDIQTTAKENTVVPAVQTADRPADVKTDVKLAAVSEETALSKHEILGQIVEKAKVLLDGSKSEMAMTLKPESLGKLSLKVVTENGIVMARFEAENQQVKQVLETNMQLLKDSLEKQGLVVQGFSVSVNDDRQRYSDNRQYFGKAERNKTVGGIATLPEVSAINNLKSMSLYQATGISSINLTA